MAADFDWPEPRPLPWRLLSRVDWVTGVSQLFGSSFDAVILYHSVGGVSGTEYRWDLPVNHFRAQLKKLNERFEIVDLATLIEQPESRRKRVAVTFDDAFRNVYQYVIPVIREFDLPATVFVCPDYIGDENTSRLRKRHDMRPSASEIVMTAPQIQDLASDDRFTIGNHTLTHPDLTTLNDEDALREEIVGSKETLEDRYGVTVDQFSYPYGAIDDAAASIVADTHDLAVTSRPALLEADRNPYDIPRLDACQPASVLTFETTDLSARLRRAVRRSALS
ncbi:polysaccharide deacetylase family protein [Halorubrum ezzemoulense]|uniref:polysaccharide deacetylase family protein n=1 Tax=Halorubrum ezzemoulense TaxID=337243 RepID=UPI00232ED5BC|nr:polysaccharide deacetylase family protein [Halorubrum ezzemoulense]MDB2250576.1 polysaccharide deacetylase family protein [Halorubrum ezzemoulense]MDB2285974.1 polysaccharide deacetylase family protein [Halorubrum ezzemoulense]